MKKNMRKLLALLLAVLSVLTLFAGCAKTETPNTPAEDKPAQSTEDKPAASEPVEDKPAEEQPAEEPATQEPKTFSVLTGVYGAATYTQDNNALWSYIQESTGVSLEMQIVPVGELAGKVKTVAASGSLPDMMKTDGPTDPYWRDLENQGAFAPIEEYLEQYPALKKICSDSVWEWMRNEDGHIYFIPCAAMWKVPFFVVYRKDVFDELGIAEPTTIAELEAALATVKAEKPDMVPWSTWENHTSLLTWYHKDLMTSFGATAGWNVDENDQLVPDQMDEGGIDFLFWLQDMRNKGYLDEEFGVSPEYGMGQVKWENGQVAVMTLNSLSYADAVRRVQENFPDAEVGILSGLVGPDGDKGGLRAIDPYTAGWYFSAENEDLDALMAYLNWSLTEGFENIYKGWEGKTYTLNESGTRIDIADDDREEAYKSYQIEPLQIMCSPDTLFGWFSIETFRAAGLDDSVYEYYMAKIDDICSNVWYNRKYPTVASPTSNDIGTQLNEAYLAAYWPGGIVLNPNVTREEYDEALQGWLEAGGQTIIDEINALQTDRSYPSYD